MRLDKKLNIVIPIYGSDDGTIIAYIHSQPLPREVFEAHYLLLGRAFAGVFSRGLGVISGPSVALMVLKETAAIINQTELLNDGLLPEIRRLTAIIMPDGNGWNALPLQMAVDRKQIDLEDLAEAENQVCFFILVSAIYRRAITPTVLASMGDLWGTSTTPLTSTAFADSLPKSIVEKTSPKAAA